MSRSVKKNKNPCYADTDIAQLPKNEYAYRINYKPFHFKIKNIK